MALVPITSVGRLGIIADKQPHTLPPEAWSGGQNIGFSENGVYRIKGQTAVYGTPSVDPYWCFPWSDVATNYWIYTSTGQAYRMTATGHTEVTRLTATGGANDYTAGDNPLWNGGVLGGVPVINNRALTDPPQVWDSGTTKFIDLTNWPASTYAKVVRPYLNFLVALHMKESGTEYPTKVRWSSSADPGTVPTSWVASGTNDAGSASLSDTTGHIVDMATLKGVNIIYKKDIAYSMQYVGGEYIFDFNILFPNLGLLAPRAVKEFFGRHFMVTQGDVVIHDGAQIQSVVKDKYRSWLFNSIEDTAEDYVFVVPNYSLREMWICFVESGRTDKLASLALIWNWRDDTWTVRELPTVAHIGIGLIDTSGVSMTFDGGSGTVFDDDLGTFGTRAYSPYENQLLMARPGSSKAFYKTNDSNKFAGNLFTSYIERVGLTISGVDRHGQPKSDPSSVKFLRAIYPKISADTGTLIDIYVGTQMSMNEAIKWHGPYSFDPSTDKKINCFVSGRFLGVKFQSSSARRWTLHGYDLDVGVLGVF